jgi:transcriptional regulator with XRE-family HTH domain
MSSAAWKRTRPDTMIEVDLSIRLKECRRRAGMKQSEAAKSSGISDKTLSSWETGARLSSMSVPDLLRLLDAYGVTPVGFFLNELRHAPTAEVVSFELGRVMQEAKALGPADCSTVIQVVRPLVLALRRKGTGSDL